MFPQTVSFFHLTNDSFQVLYNATVIRLTWYSIDSSKC